MTTHTLSLHVNGDALSLPTSGDSTKLLALVEHLDMDHTTRGVAIAVNDGVVPRSAWGAHELKDQDRIEIIRATQGG